jgi:hypothetical protein
VLTLLARHGTEQYHDAFEDIQQLYARRLPGSRHDTVIVDTSLDEAYEQLLNDGSFVIGSSNAFWEFSAWDRGVDFVGSRLDDYDVVHLATSAFRAQDARHLAAFQPGTLAALGCTPAAIGHIDLYPEPIQLYEQTSQAWIRSSWLFVRPQELLQLGSLISIQQPRIFFSGDACAPFRRDAPLSPNYQRYIVGWLTGDGTGIGGKWHSRFDLSASTLARFEAKALAILNEHALTIRLRRQGCAILDATWLATAHAQCPLRQGLCLLPSSRWQVSARELVMSAFDDAKYGAAAPIKGPPLAVRAALAAGECWDVSACYGHSAGRGALWRAVGRDPMLLVTRPVVGALRRLHAPIR